jgi:hypothetical protein
VLSQCTNVQCSKPFLRLREGKLFVVEADRSRGTPTLSAAGRWRQQRSVERFWLCDECARQWTLIYDRERGVALAPLRKPSLSETAATGSGDIEAA